MWIAEVVAPERNTQNFALGCKGSRPQKVSLYFDQFGSRSRERAADLGPCCYHWPVEVQESHFSLVMCGIDCHGPLTKKIVLAMISFYGKFKDTGLCDILALKYSQFQCKAHGVGRPMASGQGWFKGLEPRGLLLLRTVNIRVMLYTRNIDFTLT